MLRLLRRALDLWPRVPHAGLSRVDLLRRIRAAAENAGAQEEELAAVEDLLVLVDREAQALANRRVADQADAPSAVHRSSIRCARRRP